MKSQEELKERLKSLYCPSRTKIESAIDYIKAMCILSDDEVDICFQNDVILKKTTQLYANITAYVSIYISLENIDYTYTLDEEDIMSISRRVDMRFSMMYVQKETIGLRFIKQHDIILSEIPK